MTPKYKIMQLDLKREINGSPAQVFKAWLDPRNPSNCWYGCPVKVFKPKKGAFYYFLHTDEDDGEEYPHYGRFTELSQGKRVRMTWMSRNTCGLESVVTVTFKRKGKGTLLHINHANLPDNRAGMAHKEGWTYFMGELVKWFDKKGSR